MRRSRSLALLAAGAAVALTLFAPPVVAAAEVPAAVVVLGDSAAAGDGAGDYEPGTRGENGNWCHRSVHAYVHRTGLAPESVNLACSGAEAADVAFGDGTHYTEGSQAGRLVDVANRYRVTTVIVQIGANDDAALFGTGVACIRAFLDPRVPPCRETIGPLVPERMAATATKVEAAVRDVRAAMAQAGYGRGDYTLVLASYASPVTEHMLPLQAVAGCPYSRPDAAWGRTTLFPALSAALHGVAERTGARFLDMVRATEGYEACTKPIPDEEWQRRITVDPEALVHGGLDAIGVHLAQESFHPKAAAHAEMARCVREFVLSDAAAAACVAGADGRAHLEPAPAAAPAA
ncbi:MAG TPA: GDSL-type esterase/lipase family protein [Pseudonocardia sp.]|uniref:GDSL-type esterase/lipase family protein n=1 Tax=Pseudonocardia sp. TaxID=60912 RepID=UPI002B4AD14C|nr:GDSL-type esterase/lipase family protein [Pseudonocardia sp.]HLU57566.1 GDSL-type esterase/lipase family protein [Pseudonocardia sp.]